ncbi:hypothetical protein B0H16DRAFT_1482892 [Mycena metata]|uniref:Uncharacterized protein n=1 Tax=Mycena metata TaxID=1033252 RepID=A0AAD7E0A3_9AGAR|nr:hypothetical protein B0H16DRAFT_1482892 [Mycena metata]
MDVTGGNLSKVPRNSPIPLGMVHLPCYLGQRKQANLGQGDVSLLGTIEALTYKHDIASVALGSRQAEANVVRMMLKEANALAALAAAKRVVAASREAVAHAEVELAASHETEAKHRVVYLTRLYEVARQNLTDALLQVKEFEREQENAGLKESKRKLLNAIAEEAMAEEVVRSMTITLD